MTNLTHTHIPQFAEPYVSHQSEARWYGNSLWEFLVPAEVTAGKLSVFQATMPEGFSPPRHIHTREDEVFLVIDGEVCFDIDGELQLAGPGASVYMPRGVPHTFRIQSPVGRLLGVISLPLALGYAYWLPPGVPADRVAALRQAFDELMQDKEFLATAESRRLTISPRNAAAVQALVNKIVSASPELVERVKLAIGQTE